MALKRMLAVLFAVCMLVPMAACKKGDDDTTATTTVQQNGEVTTAGGEEVPTSEGETLTTETNDQGEVVVPTDADGKTQSQVQGGATTTAGGRSTTKGKVTTASRPNVSGYVGGTVNLKSGTTRADVGVDFGGKTFLTASMGDTSKDAFFVKERQLFKEKYNGVMKEQALSYDGYVQKVAAAQAGGTVFDVLGLTTDFYPALITANLCQPVTDYITKADLWDSKNPEKGGFSNSMMQQFSWSGQAYCVAGAYLQSPYVVFYNKAIFRDAGLEDPVTLYKQGKWTWEKFLEMGRDYTDASTNKYFMQSLTGWNIDGFFQTYNTDIVTLKNGVMKENLSDKRLYNALKMLQDMHYGAGRIADVKTGGNTRTERFVAGNTATCIGSAGDWTTLYNMVNGKAVFEGKTSNLGMVPAPVNNTDGVHGLYANQGYCAGIASSDPRAVICWAMLDSTYNVREAYVDSMPTEYRKLVCDVLDSDKYKAPSGPFTTSLGNLPDSAIASQICGGADITSVLASYKKQVQRILDTACK